MESTEVSHRLGTHASPKELQRLLTIATTTDAVHADSPLLLETRETARRLLPGLLLLLYKGDTQTSNNAETRITALCIDLLQQGLAQQLLCFRLLHTMSIRSRQVQHTTISNSVCSIVQTCTALLLNIRPRASDQTWASATRCIVFFMPNKGSGERGDWIDSRVLVELVRRCSRTDAEEETVTFCELLARRLHRQPDTVLAQIGGIETVSDLFAGATSPETRALLIETMLHSFERTVVVVDGHNGIDGHNGHNGHDGHNGHNGHDGHDDIDTTNGSLPVLPTPLPTSVLSSELTCRFLNPRTIAPLLHEAVHICSKRWSEHLMASFGLNTMYLEHQTLHQVTKTIYKNISKINIQMAKETSLIVLKLHHALFIRDGKCLCLMVFDGGAQRLTPKSFVFNFVFLFAHLWFFFFFRY